MKTAAVLIVDDPGGGGFASFFISTAEHSAALVPLPWEFAIQEKKNANSRELAQEEGGWDGRSWN